MQVRREHSAILSTFMKVPFAFKTFVMSIFEWQFKTGFTVEPVYSVGPFIPVPEIKMRIECFFWCLSLSGLKSLN